MKKIILKKGEERRITGGHPWVYSNEVLSMTENISLGECVDVESVSKHYLGRAFANPASKIVARIYSPSKEGADTGFFKRRIREAALRRAMLGSETSCRLVFGEADFIPGLIIDRYVDVNTKKTYLAAQFLCAGIEARRELILRALLEGAATGGEEPAAIVEKSAASAREAEGLPPCEDGAAIAGDFPQDGIVIAESGCLGADRSLFAVNLREGQKTGFFLDQRENHAAAAAFANGRRVLDAFCYTGGFAVHAAQAGAEEVIAADSSRFALELAAKNAALNGVEGIIKIICSDIFELLNLYERKKEAFGLIILDPPAFAKSRLNLNAATAGYEEINLKALSLLETGGVLVTCSCSYAITEAHFKHIIARAASRAGRRIVQTGFRSQASCHPILAGYDESHYLKCGIYTVVSG